MKAPTFFHCPISQTCSEDKPMSLNMQTPAPRVEWGAQAVVLTPPCNKIRLRGQITGCNVVRPKSTSTAVQEHRFSNFWEEHATRRLIQVSSLQALLPHVPHGHTRFNLRPMAANILSHLFPMPDGKEWTRRQRWTKGWSKARQRPRKPYKIPPQVQRDMWGYFIKQGVQHL